MWVMAGQNTDGQDEALDRALTLVNGHKVYELKDQELQAIHIVYALYEEMLGQPHQDLTPDTLGVMQDPRCTTLTRRYKSVVGLKR